MNESEIIVDYHYRGINPVQFGRETCSPGHFWGPCVRTHWLLHYVVYGFGKFEREGVVHQLRPGDLFVIPPYLETYYEADKEHPWRYIWIGFTTEDEIPDILKQPVIRCVGLGAIFEDMVRCSKMENGKTAFLCAKIWELFSILLEQRKEESDYIKKALSFMNVEYVKGITVKEVAVQLGLDRSYFSTIFKNEMKVSPQKYLLNLRLEKAAELMTAYGEKPSTAGISVGYPDLCHFSKMFKKHFGVSPRQYQQEYREKFAIKISDPSPQ